MSREVFPFGAAFVTVAAILVVLLGGGLWWWSQSGYQEQHQTAELEGAVKQCVEAVSRRDPVTEARQDAAAGEDRPLFVQHRGIMMIVSADGIPGCNADFAASDLRYPDFNLGPRTDEEEPVCCDRDPVPNACGQAQDEWVRAYNSELARLKPELVAKYCAAR